MHDRQHTDPQDLTRRQFVKTTAVLTAGTVAATPLVSRAANALGSDTIRVGLIGCGGRGTGAALNAIEASPRIQVVALADAFHDRMTSSRSNIISRTDRAPIRDEACFVGFDAYQKLLDHADVDMVILATPPHFRPIHLEAAIKAGKHVFMEKPVAVDPVGIRRVIAAGEEADRQNLSIVAGTQRRHEACYLELMKRIEGGEIGDVIAGRCYWNQGGLWHKDMQPEWSDMEWQMRNWLYFTWLSGDHIVEQHIHNIDVCNWALGGPPVKAMGMGGRQVRTGPQHGHIFDHFAIEFEYAGGARVTSMCRQIDGCASRVEEALVGTKGTTQSRSGFAAILGPNKWRYRDANPNPYVQEHKHLVASIAGEGPHLNEARRVAESTLTAIMGRMTAYTGKEITWDEMMSSQLDLCPAEYRFGSMPVPAVAVPGQTPLV